MRPLAIILTAATMPPGTALAQARHCAVPSELPRPRVEGPTVREPRRNLPTASYTLAISWSPQYCRTSGDRPGSQMQCGADNDFGFTLHGLWPDGKGREWPQYCRAAPALNERVIRQNLCVTPSVQLLQHEYAKHGTCMGISPAQYFGRSSALYRRLRYPDMDRLSRRRGLTVAQFSQAFARANPGLQPSMFRVTANREGWLDEVWICLDTNFRYKSCPAHQGGRPRASPVKIWRGH